MDEGVSVLEVLFDESGAGVDALHLEANPAYAALTGLTDVVGKKWSELVTNFAPDWLEYYVQVLQTGEPLRLERHAPALNRWFDLRIVSVGSAGQNQIAVLLRDVTARRLADGEFRRAAERDAFLVTLADALGPLADPMAIQEAATRALGGHLGASRVHYAEVTGDEALVRRDYTAEGMPSIAGVHRLSEYGRFASSEVKAGRTFVCNDVSTDERLGAEERARVSQRFGALARVSVPLLKGGVLRGLSSVQFAAPHAWAPQEVELIRETAERTWAALERTRAEAAQRESEERIRAIFQNVHDYAIVLTDARGIITEWPEGAERLFGHAAEEALGQSISIYYTPEDIAVGEHERELDEAAVEGRAERDRWRVRKGGERIWTNEIATAVRDPAGNLLGFTRIARDLTERKRAEERRLAAAEADAFRVQLTDALRAVSDPIEVSGVVANVLGEHLGAMRVLYTEIHGDKSVVHRDYTNGAPSAVGTHQLVVFERFLGRRCRQGLTTVIHDVEHDEGMPARERGALKGYGIGAIMSVPLVKAGELRATFDVHYAEPHIWTTAEVLRVEETAERGWGAVERARAEEALAKAHTELEERVAHRTSELAQMNRALAEEVSQRRRAEQMRSDLLRRLDSAQEDERRRVARDLHDQVGQTLTALTLAVRATRDAGVLPPAVSARLAEVQRAAEELGREVHGLAVRLRPTALDDLGLHAALGQLLSDWSTRTSIELDCQLADLEAVRFPPEFETVLYRVVQEALTNVARHSRAARASVVVQRVNGSVIAAVEDDGVGFEMNAVSAGRIGLLGLSERVTLVGGTLDIESAKGHGTTVLARIPC